MTHFRMAKCQKDWQQLPNHQYDKIYIGGFILLRHQLERWYFNEKKKYDLIYLRMHDMFVVGMQGRVCGRSISTG